MREIKFRAWHKAEGMIYFGDNDYHMTMDGSWYSESDTAPIVKLNECGYAFMQYTGLKDKNGKEIYEGDIITKTLTVKELNIPRVWTYEMIFKDGQFMGKGTVVDESGTNCKQTEFIEWAEEYEIIGNIYENPELLNKNKK